MRQTTCSSAHTPAQGYTLVEAMVTVALLAVMAGLAMPSYLHGLRKARRTDAAAAIAATTQAQELHRANSPRYASHFGPGGLERVGERSPDGHYLLGLTAATATGYQVTAVATGAQVDDSDCQYLRAAMDGTTGTLVYSSSADGRAWTSSDTDPCWPR